MFQLEEKDPAYEVYTQFDRLTKDVSFDTAKQEEIRNWNKNDVFEEV